MNNGYIILELEWDHQIIKDEFGKIRKILRGVDYDLEWIKLSDEYAKTGKSILRFTDPCFQKFYKIIDFETFEVLQSNNKNTTYFKDKNHVYLESYMNGFLVLENANPTNFKVLDIEKGFAASNSTDYWYNQKIPFRLKDAFLFENDFLYQKVENKIYFVFNEEIDCDASTFQLVDKRERYKTVFKDKNHVYHKGKIIEDADATTFHFLENCINEDKRPRYTNCDIHYFAKDKNYAYFVNSPFEIKKIKTKDLAGFDFKVVDSEGYAFDSNYTYYRGKRKKLSRTNSLFKL